MSDTQIFYSKHAGGITAFIGGVPVIFAADSQNYEAAEAALKAKNWSEVVRLSSVKNMIKAALSDAKETRIVIEGGELVYFGPKGREVLHGSLVDRIMIGAAENQSNIVKPLMALLANISRNKLKDIRTELYEFLMSGKAPITQDGCFLAFKKVEQNGTGERYAKAPKSAKFVDIYTRTLDNSPGVLVAMDEDKVDTNRSNECSVGLHFCTRGYLSNYSSSGNGKDVVVVVKVNPRHVFAIPRDYNCAKGRASEYFVVGVCTGDPVKDDLFLKPFIMDNQTPETAVAGVKFVQKSADVEDEGSAVLKPGLKTIARGYRMLTDDDKIVVHVRNTKGEFATSEYAVCRLTENGEWASTRTKTVVPVDQIQEMHFKTKSAHAALVRAIAKRRGSI